MRGLRHCARENPEATGRSPQTLTLTLILYRLARSPHAQARTLTPRSIITHLSQPRLVSPLTPSLSPLRPRAPRQRNNQGSAAQGDPAIAAAEKGANVHTYTCAYTRAYTHAPPQELARLTADELRKDAEAEAKKAKEKAKAAAEMEASVNIRSYNIQSRHTTTHVFARVARAVGAIYVCRFLRITSSLILRLTLPHQPHPHSVHPSPPPLSPSFPFTPLGHGLARNRRHRNDRGSYV